MIPINFINQWRQNAPWTYQSQIEQDLVLSRALIALYQKPIIQEFLAFRGGTALNKLFCNSAQQDIVKILIWYKFKIDLAVKLLVQSAKFLIHG